MKPHMHIGTSGWNYNHWRGSFYPADLPPHQWLEYYASRMGSVEINNSFYHLPTRNTFSRWSRTVPDGFTFSVKANRYITHMKKLLDPQRPVKKLLRHVEGLGKKVEVILFQLPPRWRFNRERLAGFLPTLSNEYRYAFEFRDESWWNRSTYDMLTEHNAAFCIFELGKQQSPKETTTDFVYVRLHGWKHAYRGEYGRPRLAGWAGAFSSWKRQGKTIFCYFDNDEKGFATKDALALSAMLQ